MEARTSKQQEQATGKNQGSGDMRHPQIVIYEPDGWLAAQVAELARSNAWLVRESRQPDACLQLLREVRLSILLLKWDLQMSAEWALLAQVQQQVPLCPVVVVSDGKHESQEQKLTLAGLAYDLGATYVLFPPLTRTVIEDLASGLLEAALQRLRGEDICANSPS